jgi:hypothetical protein
MPWAIAILLFTLWALGLIRSVSTTVRHRPIEFSVGSPPSFPSASLAD